jgi:hypothetical protein
VKTALDGALPPWLLVLLIVFAVIVAALAFRAYLAPDALLWFGNMRLC